MSHDRKGVVIIYPKGFERKNEDLSKIQTSTETLNINKSDTFILKEESNFEEASKERSNSPSFIKHMESVHSVKKQYQCPICKKRFQNKHYIAKHVESVHEGQKPYKCSICDASFTQNPSLKYHMENVHKNHVEILNSVHEGKTLTDFGEASNEAFISTIADTSISKPKTSYPKLISEALLNSPNGMLILSDIYESISTRHPVYKMNDTAWKNCVKRNLTIDKSFVKSNDKKGSPWKLSENLSTSSVEKKEFTEILYPETKLVEVIIPPGLESKTEVFNMTEVSNFEEAFNESEVSCVTDISKPKMSFAQLISEALLNSPNGMLILADIYKSISTRHPYYQMNVIKWQNSVKTQLSINQSFVKSTDKTGSPWKLSENPPGFESKTDEINVQFSGNFNENTNDKANCDPFVDTMTFNPWLVESLEEFAYLKCPECSFDCKEDNIFKEHALENHPLSIVLFGVRSNCEDFKVKEELSDTSLVDEKDQDMQWEPDYLDYCESKLEEFDTEPIVEDHPQNYDSENPNSCKICKISFKKRKHYQDHLTHLDQSGTKSMKCCACDKKYNFNSSLIKHLESVHSVKQQYQCPVCKKSFKYKQSIAQHVASVHEGQKPYKCSICDASFTQNTSLKYHMENVHKNHVEILNSVHEGKTFTDCFVEREDLKQDKSSVHEGKKMFKCSICKIGYDSEDTLKKHLLSEHEGKKIYFCSLCDNTFSSWGDLKKHTRTIHEGKKLHKCFFCDDTFSYWKALKKHIDTEHEGKKPYNCSLCATGFLTKTNLLRHIDTEHEGKKPYNCSLCSTGFLIQKNLLHHTITVHEEKRPYKCSFCDKYFKTTDGVKNHSGKCVEHLKISPKLGPGERACCIQCDKTYINKSALRQHVEVVHLKMKKFQCDQCPLNFASRMGFKYHMESQHEKKEHPCTKCDRIFKTKDCLKAHVLKHHEKRLDFKCEFCGNEFPTLSEVNRHIKVLHANNVKCELCDKILNNPKKLLKHKYIHHNEKYLLFRCDECPTSGPIRKGISTRLFLTQALFDKHKKRFHPF